MAQSTTSQSSLHLPGLQWRVELSKHWDVLGPFPIHAREQQYLSPSFPLNLSQPLNLTGTWPSSYADGGKVTWITSQLKPNGEIEVFFPNIRNVWRSLQMTEGWAALQHHAILRTTLTVYPPKDSPSSISPRLRIQLIQGSYFTILPTDDTERTTCIPTWYTGNIYNLERSLPRTVDLPSRPSLIQPTTYDLFISGDYEIRLFGDPRVQDSEVPVQKIRLSVDFDVGTESIVREPTQDILCDFVGGFAFGEAIGIGLRSVSGWWTITGVSTRNAPGVDISLQHKCRILPTQMRIIPIFISQRLPFHESNIDIDITMMSKGLTKIMSTSLPVRHHIRWGGSSNKPITASYFYAQSMPTAFKVIPPATEPRTGTKPILALHGAGVDIMTQSFWADSLPHNQPTWVVIPTGRTSWGLDWHGPSARDAWGSLDALFSILKNNQEWVEWNIEANSRAIIIGHSNGGQGAWYLASHYPDRVAAVIPAAAYIKPQAYVPLILSRSAHFIDPALRAVLESSLTPDDNDLHLSNLIDTPILAIHGGSDENVPVWHSREVSGILQAFSQDITFREDAGKGHWYPEIFDNPQVQGFLDRVQGSQDGLQGANNFVLTVSDPVESGSLHGWSIGRLTIPGRIGRLRIREDEDGHVHVLTSNVNTFSLDARMKHYRSVYIDHTRLSTVVREGVTLYFTNTGQKRWQVSSEGSGAIQAPSRIQNLLVSSGPFVLIVPDFIPSQHFSVALRLAHDLNTYHRLHAEILTESEAFTVLESASWPKGNIVHIGPFSSRFAMTILRSRMTPFELSNSRLHFNGEDISRTGMAALFLHPHPSPEMANHHMMFILSADSNALERAARLFPIRSGVAVPSWILIDSRADNLGAAGVHGAGVWGHDWSWSDSLSYME